MENKNVQINITGDFVVNQPYLVSNLHDDVVSFFGRSDFNIVNLEAPITEKERKILKTGPHLKADKSSALEVLKALNINVATLANNHILDYEEEGVLDTISFCNDNDILHVGAGKNMLDAAKILCLNTTQGKIGIINIAENEWASATNECAGGNGMDFINNHAQICEAKKEFDFVFVIVHGGHEYYNLPSPRAQKLYRFFIDSGADIVVGHHPHCMSGFEIYKGKHIYYSLGNFLFTKPKDNRDWYEGLILEINIRDRNLETRIHGVKQSKNRFELKFFEDHEINTLNSRLQKFNSIITNEDSLRRSWSDYVDRQFETYIKLWSPVSFITNRYLKGFFRRFYKLFVNKDGFKYYLNLMKCEAHSDLSREIIQKFLKK